MSKIKNFFYRSPSSVIKELVDSKINRENLSALENEIIYSYPVKNFPQIVTDIIKNYPEQVFYFLNVAELRQKIAIIQKNFIPENPNRVIAYAVKANPKPAILKILIEAGINSFDCASIGEVKLVRSICPEANILYNNPVKSQKSIIEAYHQGVRHFTVQHHSEIAKILNSPHIFDLQQLEIAVRLGLSKGGAKVDFSEKYGASENTTVKLLNIVGNNLKSKPGISIHVGSQNNSLQSFQKAIKKMAQIAKYADHVQMFNVGGGIPVNYEGASSNLFDYLSVISEAVRNYLPVSLHPESKIIIELGRSIIAEPVDLIIPIIGKETRGRKALYFDDGIFTSFSDYVIHDWKYHFQVLDKQGKVKKGNLVSYLLFGRTCDPGDCLGEVLLPENVNIGDYLWVPKAGAYMDSQSSAFNGFESPTYIYYNF